jgi:hypothetical protein
MSLSLETPITKPRRELLFQALFTPLARPGTDCASRPRFPVHGNNALGCCFHIVFYPRSIPQLTDNGARSHSCYAAPPVNVRRTEYCRSIVLTLRLIFSKCWIRTLKTLCCSEFTKDYDYFLLALCYPKIECTVGLVLTW